MHTEDEKKQPTRVSATVMRNLAATAGLPPIDRLKKDLELAGRLQVHDVRRIVDLYYQVQDWRVRTEGQVRAALDDGEPHAFLAWIFAVAADLENGISTMMDHYTQTNPVGQWARSITGIGPVIAAGLLAHIDITRCRTVGQLWRFAGYDPTFVWLGRKGAQELVASLEKKTLTYADVCVLAERSHRKPDSLWKQMCDGEAKETITATRAQAVLARRPWNASLKLLCWKIGESFSRSKGSKNSQYGRFIDQRKAYETMRSERGDFREYAALQLQTKRYGTDTAAYAAYKNGKLPAGQCEARSRRWAVKLFLSHYHHVAYRHAFHTDPPAPYPLAILEHADRIEIPNPPWVKQVA